MIKPRNNTLPVVEEMKNKSKRILIYKQSESLLFFAIEDKKLIGWGEENPAAIAVGDIYVGRVVQVQKSIKGAFVQIGKEKKCFLPAEEHAKVLRLNVAASNRAELKQEDFIVLRIKKTAVGSKLPMAVAKTMLSEEQIEALAHMPNTGLVQKGPGAMQQFVSKHPLREKDYFIFNTPSAKELFQRIFPDIPSSLLRVHEETAISMWNLYSMETILSRVTQKKIWLKCGGNIVVETTEACHVIDVNTAKNCSATNREETLLKTNLEALSEILYQVSVRNLGGILIIDFINMKDEDNITILQDACKAAFRSVNPPLQYVEYTKLGLVEATRAKTGAPFYEFFSKIDRTILL